MAMFACSLQDGSETMPLLMAVGRWAAVGMCLVGWGSLSGEPCDASGQHTAHVQLYNCAPGATARLA